MYLYLILFSLEGKVSSDIGMLCVNALNEL